MYDNGTYVPGKRFNESTNFLCLLSGESLRKLDSSTGREFVVQEIDV